VPPVLTTADTGARTGDDRVSTPAMDSGSESTRGSGHAIPSRAVSRNRSCGKALVLGVQLDRFDHQVECVDAVHFACHTVGIAWSEVKAFSEVEQAIHTPSVVVLLSAKTPSSLSDLLFQPIIVMQSAEDGLRCDSVTDGRPVPMVAGRNTRLDRTKPGSSA
jgi:hypothetical protein